MSDVETLHAQIDRIPLTRDLPMPCPVCHAPIVAGESIALVPIGPGSDPEEQRRRRLGQTYTAIALACHWACITGDSSV
jgi:hypothetical protein